MTVEVSVSFTLHNNNEESVRRRILKFLETGETFDQLKVEVVRK